MPALKAADPALELVALGGDARRGARGCRATSRSRGIRRRISAGARWACRAPQPEPRVDVIHAPAYTAPLWSSAPVVLTIHDVSYERHPEWYPYQRDALRRMFYRRSARTAARVLTDSEFSAGEIAAAYQIPRERITVAPLGVSDHFAPSDRPGETLPAGITSPFLLHVGDLHERRNLPLVVHAMFEAQRRPGMPPLSLVLAGVDRGIGDRLAGLRARSEVA